MNRAIIALLVILLTAGTIFNGAMLLQSDSALATVKTSIAQAQADESALQSSIAALQASVAQLGSSIQASNQGLSAVIAKIQPSVVYIEASGRGFAGTGSGVIIRSNGYVLTNHHVTDLATSISVTLSTGDKFTATVVKSNADFDLSVIKLNTTRTDLPAATLGTASDVVVGKGVIACGFPLGSELPGPATFTSGIVSAIRNMVSWGSDNPAVRINYVQTDAAITHGNSGGGLFTMDGRMIGVPSYGALSDVGDNVAGFNLAIPMDTILPYIQSTLG